MSLPSWRTPAAWLSSPAARAVAGIVAAVLVAFGVIIGVAVSSGPGTKHLVAEFPQTIGLYEGNSVDIMGVKVGTVDRLTNEGSYVRADISYDGQYKLPADVKAAIITPAVVSDRYVELTPAYTGGPVLPDNATLGLDRTAVPLEFDQIFRNLDQLNRALGPNGANKHGALSYLIKISDRNLAGNGKRLNRALANFTRMISTLAGSRGNLFATVSHLQRFTTTLARDDGGVRALNRNLERVGAQLNGERHNLAAALSNLSGALRLVGNFVNTNRAVITRDLHGATKITHAIVAEKAALEQLLDDAPIALANLSLAGDPKARTLDTKANLTYEASARQLCQTVVGVLGALIGSGASQACQQFPDSSLAGLPMASRIGSSRTLPRSTDGLSALLGGVRRR